MTSLLVLAACSGAKPQLVDETPSDPTPTASTPDAGNPPIQPSGDDDDTGSSGSGGSGSSSGSGSGGSSNGGTTVGAPAPAACPADGVTEDGTNDSRSTAIAFTSAACGMVTASGEDWWRFTLPSNAKTLAFEYSGKVDLEISSEGQTVIISGGTASGPLPFHPSGEYEIGVTSATGAGQAYVLVAEDQ